MKPKKNNYLPIALIATILATGSSKSCHLARGNASQNQDLILEHSHLEEDTEITMLPIVINTSKADSTLCDPTTVLEIKIA